MLFFFSLFLHSTVHIFHLVLTFIRCLLNLARLDYVSPILTRCLVFNKVSILLEVMSPV